VAETPSTMLALQTQAPEFSLPDPVTGETVSLSDFARAPALVVMVLSNHCPFVKHVASELADFGRDYQERGVGIVAICGNDARAYPADSAENMAREVQLRGYSFPYLFDESQDVLKAYRAACTPDFFLFDGCRELAYRGQFDGSRPSLNVPVTGNDLRTACDTVLAGRQPKVDQYPSIGCNIKWKTGNTPNWFA
jgi:peroxiredoxin